MWVGGWVGGWVVCGYVCVWGGRGRDARVRGREPIITSLLSLCTWRPLGRGRGGAGLDAAQAGRAGEDRRVRVRVRVCVGTGTGAGVGEAGLPGEGGAATAAGTAATSRSAGSGMEKDASVDRGGRVEHAREGWEAAPPFSRPCAFRRVMGGGEEEVRERDRRARARSSLIHFFLFLLAASPPPPPLSTPFRSPLLHGWRRPATTQVFHGRRRPRSSSGPCRLLDRRGARRDRWGGPRPGDRAPGGGGAGCGAGECAEGHQSCTHALGCGTGEKESPGRRPMQNASLAREKNHPSPSLHPYSSTSSACAASPPYGAWATTPCGPGPGHSCWARRRRPWATRRL